MPRYYWNVLIVFLVSGLWHGADWTFVVWGALHGFYLLAGSITALLRNRLRASLRLGQGPLLSGFQVLITFSLVALAWVFFRAANVRDGFFIVSHMLVWRGFRVTDLFSLGLPRFELLLAFFLIASVAVTGYAMAFEPPAGGAPLVVPPIPLGLLFCVYLRHHFSWASSNFRTPNISFGN